MNVSLYTPLAVQSATLDGKAVALSDERELGWKVHSTPLTVAGGQSRTLVVHLTGKIDPGGYHLTLAPQPAVNPESVGVEVNAGADGRISKASSAVTEVRELDPST
jgi:hypothetical protein